jgi:hypothetical protein
MSEVRMKASSDVKGTRRTFNSVPFACRLGVQMEPLRSSVVLRIALHARNDAREWPMHALPKHLSSVLVGILSVPLGIWSRIGEPVKGFGDDSHSSPIGQMVQEASDMG